MLFVGIWATGFLVARLVAGHADPLTFLTIRFALTAAVFAVIARLAKVAWPRSVRQWRDSAIAGILLLGQRRPAGRALCPGGRLRAPGSGR